MPERLTIFGPFLVRDGYGNTVINISKELIKLDVDLQIRPLFADGNEDVPDEVIRRKELNRSDDCEIAMTPPTGIKFLHGKHKILLTMYEHDRLSPEWIEASNHADLIIVPCDWCKNVWRNSGVYVPIEVVNLGIDSKMWPLLKRPEHEFYTFFMAGTLIRRKNPSMLIQAFLEEFDEWDARLVIKSLEGLPIEYRGSDPRVKIINQAYSQEKLIELYRQVDCFVYPSSGEGFGLPPVEAMSTGLPVIFSNSTGMQDFANPGINFPIPTLVTESIVTSVGHEGTVPIPCVKTMKRFMRFCYENREYVRQMGEKASAWVQERFTWRKTATSLLQILRDRHMLTDNQTRGGIYASSKTKTSSKTG